MPYCCGVKMCLRYKQKRKYDEMDESAEPSQVPTKSSTTVPSQVPAQSSTAEPSLVQTQSSTIEPSQVPARTSTNSSSQVPPQSTTQTKKKKQRAYDVTEWKCSTPSCRKTKSSRF